MSFSTLEFLFLQSAKAVRRNPLVALAAVTNVAVGLAILGAFGLAALNLHNMADQEAKSAVITCELQSTAVPADVEAALLADLRVKRTKFLSRDEALEQTAAKLKWDVATLKLLGNPLPDSMLVWVRDPEQIELVRAAAQKINGVKLARYPQQITKKILVVARGVKLAGLIVGTVLVLAILTVINTTIRLTIYARRREIRIMQLVGATRWFIRLPFLLEGVFYGLLGGVAATALLVPSYLSVCGYVTENLDFLRLLADTRLLVSFAAALIGCGLLFGAMGSLAGIRRYLRLV